MYINRNRGEIVMKKIYKKCILLGLLVGALVGCGEKQEEVKLTQVANPIFIAEGVRGVSITKQNKEIINIVYEPQAGEATFEYWKMKIPYGDEAVINTEEALKLYQQLVLIDTQRTPSDEKANFEEPLGKIKIDFCQTTEEERNTALMGQVPDKESSPSYKAVPDSTATLLIGDNDGRGNYYVAYEGNEQNVSLLSESMVDVVLDINPFDYILKLSAVADRETMKSVTIKMDGQTHKLSEKQLEEQVYRTLYNDIFSVYIIEEIPDSDKVGKETVLEINGKRNVKGAPNLHISYHPWDSEMCAVKVNGKAHFLVKSTDVEALKAKITEAFSK